MPFGEKVLSASCSGLVQYLNSMAFGSAGTISILGAQVNYAIGSAGIVILWSFANQFLMDQLISMNAVGPEMAMSIVGPAVVGVGSGVTIRSMNGFQNQSLLPAITQGVTAEWGGMFITEKLKKTIIGNGSLFLCTKK